MLHFINHGFFQRCCWSEMLDYHGLSSMLVIPFYKKGIQKHAQICQKKYACEYAILCHFIKRCIPAEHFINPFYYIMVRRASPPTMKEDWIRMGMKMGMSPKKIGFFPRKAGHFQLIVRGPLIPNYLGRWNTLPVNFWCFILDIGWICHELVPTHKSSVCWCCCLKKMLGFYQPIVTQLQWVPTSWQVMKQQ